MKVTKVSETNKPEVVRDWIFYSAIGIIAALLSTLMFYTAFSGGFTLEPFIIAIVFGAISFLCFSSWKRLNFLISGVIFLSAGIWMLSSLLDYRYDDFWLALIWTPVLLLVGLSFFLRFFNTTLFKSIHRVSQTKPVKLIAKIVAWSALVVAGLFVIVGLFSILAGLSATAIIIVLLILIYFKQAEIADKL